MERIARRSIVKRMAESVRDGNDGEGDAFAVKAGSIAPGEEAEFMSAEEFFGD